MCARAESDAAKARVAEHLNGKQHQAWDKIRNKLTELRSMNEGKGPAARQRVGGGERRESDRDKERDGDRDRERDRGRDSDRGRDYRDSRCIAAHTRHTRTHGSSYASACPGVA